MITDASIEVYCDGKGCESGGLHLTLQLPYYQGGYDYTQSWLEGQLKEFDWIETVTGRHLCPDCQEDEK